MYLKHFGLNEPPFRITPHTDFFFAGANRGAMLEALQYALLHDEGIVKVSGEVGSGKTMLCRVLMERLPAQVEIIYLANPSLARDEILLAIADELQLDLGRERQTRVLRALQDALIERYASGRRVVVLIDEAHAMPPETLEEIRLLSNLEANRHKLLQIVLFGQPELDAHLGVPQMRQLKERITHSFRLGPLTREEITSYIDYRMRAAGYRGPSVFSAKAIRLLADASEGLTRRVNILADKSLLSAFASNTHAVTPREVRRAISDSDFYHAPPNRARYAWLGAGAVAGLLLGCAIAFVLAYEGLLSGPAPAKQTPLPFATGQTNSAPATAIPPSAEKESSANPALQSPAGTTAAGDKTDATSKPPVQDTPPPATGNAVSTPVQSDNTDPSGAKKGQDSGDGIGRTKYALVNEKFLSTQNWLKDSPGNSYSIQLVTVRATDLAKLENFLAKASRVVPSEELHVYSVKIDGVQHYRASFGTFPTPSAAATAIRELPALLSGQNPYPRSIERMRSQNRQ